MPREKLTARRVESLSTTKPREEYWDTLTPGLLLRVSGETGRKTWYVRYRVNGTRRRQKLGTFPALELAEARDDARDAMRRAHKGEDPAQEREERKKGDHTFQAMAEEVLKARRTKTRERTIRERRRLLEKEVLPAWRGRNASEITRRDVHLLVERISRRGAPVTANRTLSLIHLLFNDGLRRGFPGIEANPAHLIEPPGVEEGRDRYLDRAEIQKVWEATERERPGTRGAFRLVLLTAQRIGSVSAMRWDGIVGRTWTIPEEHFKGKRPHVVPMSDEALALLEELREVAASDTWVFPSRAGSKKPYVTNLSGALQRVRDASEIEHWTLHDIRTTFRTWATRSTKPEPGEPAGLGIPGHVADAVLGHKEASLGFKRYTGDRDRYLLPEKREALDAWGAFVANAVGGGR